MKHFFKQGLLLATILLCFNQYAHASFTVSGRISLPTGVVAGSGGAVIDLSGLFFEFSGRDRDRVTIPQGQSSVRYSLTFSGEDDQEIQFECVRGCFNLGITTEGSWNVNRGVVGTFNGTDFSRTRNHTVNILLERATRFSGRVSFPQNFRATGDEFIFVRVSSNDRFSFTSFSTSGFLSRGQTSFSFQLGVPPTETQRSWELSVSCSRCSAPIIDETNYATTARGNPTALSDRTAFAFPRSGNFGSLSLTMQGIAPPMQTPPPVIAPILLLLED